MLKMSNLFVVAIASVTMLGSLNAGGFISNLPKDGTRVVYELKFIAIESDENGPDLNSAPKVELELASVGKGPKVKGQPTRWIEIVNRMVKDDKDRTEIAVCLFRESQLTRKETAMESLIKGATQRLPSPDINLDTDRIKDIESAPFALLVGVKSQSIKELGQKTWTVLDKKHECDGIQTVIEVEESGFRLQLDAYYNDDVPFGLVKGTLVVEQKNQKVTAEIKLIEIKEGAKPSIPLEKIVDSAKIKE
ncbi:MAG TPA: hypothetical protein DCP67_02285 [Planctomycetaceae bacterium]|nr:hypothetical protein [Planctomycetaceae bacterium]